MTESPVPRARREPPPFRRVSVASLEPVTPRLTRVTFAGDELEGLEVNEPAASVRLLVPHQGEELTLPTWNGNEFLRADGSRPFIRTFTPRRFDPDVPKLDLEIVVHDEGAVSDWVRSARPGDRAAVSGTGRGYRIEPEVESYLLAGDESAIPAICQIVESLDPKVGVSVIIEVADRVAQLDLPPHPGTRAEWVLQSDDPGDALVAAVAASDIHDEGRVWVAGEAAAVQRIRRHLFDERGLSRRQATVRGYWKRGRGGVDSEES